MPALKYRTWATCLSYVSEYGFRNRKYLLVESGIPLTIKFRIQVEEMHVTFLIISLLIFLRLGISRFDLESLCIA